MTAIPVNAEALRQVLKAFAGPIHHVMEMSVGAGRDDSPVKQLQADYDAAMKTHPREWAGVPARLLADLTEAAATLRRYEASHRAKDTADSLAKAEVNAELATRFEATIAASKVKPPYLMMWNPAKGLALMSDGSILTSSDETTWTPVGQPNADEEFFTKHGHEPHCNLCWPATMGTDEDFCDCRASKEKQS